MENTTPQHSADEALWKAKEAAQFFSVSEDTILRWKHAGILPAVVMPNSPRILLFRPSTMREIARQFEQATPSVAQLIGSAR